MAKYVMQAMPDMQGRDREVYYPRLVVERCISLKELACEVAEQTSFGRGEVEGLLSTVMDVMQRYLSWGYSVGLDGLGTFTARLGMKDEKREGLGEARLRSNAQSVEVRGVSYRADKGFVREIRKKCQPRRTQRTIYTVVSAGMEERWQLAQSYIVECGSLSRGDYARLTGLSPSSASRELMGFARAGKLCPRGQSSHRVYTFPIIS